MAKKIFITGVSSGIGYATADYFLSQGFKVIGTYRKSEDVKGFVEQYPKSFIGIKVDLSSLSEIETVPQVLNDYKIESIDFLLNNAGIALAGPLEYHPFSEVQSTLQINVLAVIRITQLILPFLKKSAGARVVNISSVAGIGGTPFLGVYAASKHAVEGFSEALRRELKLYDIQVSIIGPGSIKTPIWRKNFSQIESKYDQTEYKKSFRKFIEFAEQEERNALHVDAVVACVQHAFLSPSPCIRYAPVPHKWKYKFEKLIPKSIYDYLMCKTLGLLNK
ncbi:MAG: SDR family oxidoreductase [Pseudobdellovibrio sp.]